MKNKNFNRSIITSLLVCASQVLFSQNDTLLVSNRDTLVNFANGNHGIAPQLLTQSDIETQNIVFAPKSPTVAGLVQAIDCPVSYYTGVPEINIPFRIQWNN